MNHPARRPLRCSLRAVSYVNGALAACLVALATILPGTVGAVPPQPRALVLDDPALPDYDAALAAALRRTVAKAGYDAAPVSVAALREPDALTSAKGCALLVLPHARTLPVALIPAVEAYARRGGNLLVLGAPAWGNPSAVLRNGQWQTSDDEADTDALRSPTTSFLRFDTKFPVGQLIRETNTPQVETRMETDPTHTDIPGKEAGALSVTVPSLSGWDMWRTPDLARSPFGPGQTVTVFSARGGPRTRRLAVEWDERDGSRWIAVVPLTTKWRQYRLSPADFQPWGVAPERERAGFHPENAVRFKAGLAFTHTGARGGTHEYALAGVGTETASAQKETPAAPILETVSPRYKFSRVGGSDVRLTTPGDASPLVTPTRWEGIDPATLGLLSSPPRATGAGFAKQREWRWLPLLVARDGATGQWRGTPATLWIRKSGGVWAAFALDNAAFYRQAETQTLIGDIARRIRGGLFLVDGGADAYTALPGQSLRLGATFTNAGDADQPVKARVTVAVRPGTTPVWQKTWSLNARKHASVVTPAATWTLPKSPVPAGGYVVTAELLHGGAVIDRVQHRLHVWTPTKQPQFVTRRDGHFWLDGKLWRACGVNYAPSSGIAQETHDLYQRWLDPPAYDPESVERDLFHIEELGFNAVSAWVYAGEATWQNLIDFLRRCRAHKLKVSLMLAPDVGSPAAADALRGLIEKFRFADNDTLFAYEIAWEPEFNGYEARKPIDAEWERWITARYGSVAEAERDWGVSVPRGSDGKVTNPSDDALSRPDGSQARLAVDYRRFLDDYLAGRYGPVAKRLKEIDPRHLVSFRMSYAGDPTARGRTPYQFEGLARAVDFLAPEAYGRVGDWERVRPGWFTVAYARAVAPSLPVLWAEAGMSVWEPMLEGGGVDPALLQEQGQFYEDFFKMAAASGADGIFFWWYAGGFRVGEASDYGLLNPDGTDRPAAVAVRRHATVFKSAPAPQTPEIWLAFDRDAHPDGIVGVYEALSARFWSLIAQGQRPGLRSAPAAGTPPSKP